MKSRPVLDAGCGFGRNAVAVALRGLDIVCADNDAARLSTLTKLAPAYFDQHRLPDQAPGQLRTVCIDLNASSWPFGYEEFSSIVCVQFPNFGLIDAFRKSIFRGGFLYLETFGGHGENYVDLPNAGHLRRVLEKDYELAFYRERSVGPPRYSKVSAKLLARNL